MSLAPRDPAREIDRLDAILAACVTRRDELRAAVEEMLDDAQHLDLQADQIEDRVDVYLDRRNALSVRLELQTMTEESA